ncbi:hypothetical protein roselon_00605 [Roseibacterium elongatum DSM 19469]|uniref:Uncharacterized protein n=2 Tax=Roseicyclus elongatus TaxID=159346 RepID=W8SKK3_9RHOB|nr:hypothetical protein roselon_00605 [Roseibacterium elongatum DSM 19469]
MRLARDEADAEEIMELTSIVEQLEGQVATARAAANKEKTMTKNGPAKSPADLEKALAANRRSAERQLDDLAKSMMEPGETFEKAYSRAIDSEMGRAMLRTLDDATALQTGQPTEADLDTARKNLMEG